MSEDDRARFYREAKAAAQLDHPHFASVFEIDEAVPGGSKDDDLRPFIAMEFIEGETLRSRKKKGPLKGGKAVRLRPALATIFYFSTMRTLDCEKSPLCNR